MRASRAAAGSVTLEQEDACVCLSVVRPVFKFPERAAAVGCRGRCCRQSRIHPVMEESLLVTSEPPISSVTAS